MTSKKEKPIIQIFDDDEIGFGKEVKKILENIEEVKKNFRVNIMLVKEFKVALNELQERRKRARMKKVSTSRKRVRSEPTNLLDSTDIFIVDFDLLHFYDGFITGEEIAYLARCYSSCGLIIACNQFIRFGENCFDLTLKGHPESYADLNLTMKQLENSGLWVDQWKAKMFRPWYWPSLPQALNAFGNRVESIKSSEVLDSPILEYLGIPEEITDTMLRSARAFLGPEDDVRKITFRQFVEDSGNGLRDKDTVVDDESIARIAGARIHKWLERLVLPSQDILVDAPHMVSRFPSLLKSRKKTAADFDKTAVLNDSIENYLDMDVIKKYRFQRKDWLSRPAWYSASVSADENIEEVARPWNANAIKWVFCEDVSRFLPRNVAREFVADFASPFARRFVVDSKTNKDKEYSAVLSNVSYVPSLRFSL